MKAFSYARPTTLADAMKLLSPTARPKGGGNDLLDLAKRGVSTPDVMVDVRAMLASDAVYMRTHSGQVFVGPSVKLAEIAASPVILEHCPVLADAAREAATPQIRNTATIAGNLLQRPHCAYFRDPFFDCRKRGGTACPAFDGVHDEMAIFGNAKCCAVHPSNLATALVAIGATLTVVEKASAPNEGDVRDANADTGFFLRPEEDMSREANVAPNELLGGIVCRRAPVSAYVEINQKQSFDWASVACAVVLDVEDGKIKDARVALGAVAPVPLLSKAAADALRGKPLRDEAAWDAAGIAACEGATPLRDNKHKVRQLRVVVRRAIAAAVARAK